MGCHIFEQNFISTLFFFITLKKLFGTDVILLKKVKNVKKITFSDVFTILVFKIRGQF